MSSLRWIAPLTTTLALAGSAAVASAETLPWIHDDWARAAATAGEKSQLVAVDVWATWCHTCLSMKSFTLEERPLGRVRDQLTWLSLDYDRPENAAFFKEFPVSAFPTFLVVDPVGKKIVARWIGSGTSEEMAAFFASARLDATDPLSVGLRALAEKKPDVAEPALREALAKSEKPGLDRTRALSGLLEILSARDPEACATLGLDAIAQTEDSSPGLDAVAMAVDCADQLAEKQPTHALVPQLRTAALARLARAEKSAAFKRLSADDQSGVYMLWVGILDAQGKKPEATALTERRLATLEKAAKAAKTAAARATFDPHRVECYIRLARYEPAEKMLAASAAALPKDFNPPARLALVLRAKGDLEGAKAAIERALALGYGPRKVRLYSTQIDVLTDLKRTDDALKAVDEARAFIKSLDPGLVRSSWTKALDAQAARLGPRAS